MYSDELSADRLSPHIMRVSINRPEQRNSVSRKVAQGLAAAVREAEEDADIRVVLLTGAGDKSFCAGADLKEVAAGRGRDLTTADGGFAGFIEARRRTPWIAVVDAPAYGGGVEICLACDMVVASTRAAFALPEVARGIIAGAAGVFRLPRRIPAVVANEMLATGKPVSAERAHALGLVNRLAEPGRAFEEAILLAEDIAANAPLAVQASLALARQAFDLDEGALFDLMRTEVGAIIASSDAKEGPRAFVEKRAPVWQGR